VMMPNICNFPVLWRVGSKRITERTGFMASNNSNLTGTLDSSERKVLSLMYCSSTYFHILFG
jgi:hypothetical protein